MNEQIFNLSPMSIFTMGEAVSNGYKFAFVKGNRNLSAKNITSKKYSLKKYNGNLIPIMVIEGDKALAEGCVLTDVTTGDPIEDGRNVLAIIDGQHRTQAAINLGFDKSNIHCFLSYSDVSTVELLAITNTDSTPWNGADYAKCAVTMQPKDKMAQFISGLADKGFSPSTISLILFRKKGVLTKQNLGRLITGEGVKCTVEPKYDFAKRFLEAAGGFPDSFVAKRYLIEAVLEVSVDEGIKPVCDKLASWDDEKRKQILDTPKSKQKEQLVELLKA